VLDGITRATVIELARDRGIEVEIGPIAVRDLLEADEVFLSGTSSGLVLAAPCYQPSRSTLAPHAAAT